MKRTLERTESIIVPGHDNGTDLHRTVFETREEAKKCADKA